MECVECSLKSTNPLQCKTCNAILCSSPCLIHHIPKHHKNIFQIKHHSKKENQTSSLKPKVIKSKYLTEGKFITNTSSLPKHQFFLNPILSKTGQKVILGSGTFGQVVMERNIIDNKIYAVKYMEKSRLINIIGSLNPIYNEIEIHYRLQHDNIIKLYKCKETKYSFELIMEYANCGSLFHYVRNRKGLNEKEAFKFFIQVCNAVLFLHRNNLIHRDLKPENILLVDYEKVKLCDFGWCTQISNEQNRNTYCGTLEYMAPEMIMEQHYNKGIDIWSLGILLYELIHGYSPFRASSVNNVNNREEIIHNIKKHEIDFCGNVSKECKELINAMLCVNNNKRISIEDIFESDFVKLHDNSEYKKVKSKTIEVERTTNTKRIINETFETNNSIIINYTEDDNDKENGCIDNDEELDNVSLELCIKQKPHSIRNQNLNDLNIYSDTLKETEEWLNQRNLNHNCNNNNVIKENELSKTNALNTIQINFQKAKSCLDNNILQPKKKQIQKSNIKTSSFCSIDINNNNKLIQITDKNKINNIFLSTEKDKIIRDNKHTMNNISNNKNNNNNTDHNIKKIYKKFKMKNHSRSIDSINSNLNTTNRIQPQKGKVINNNYVSQLSTKPNSIISYKILFEAINIVNNSKRNII